MVIALDSLVLLAAALLLRGRLRGAPSVVLAFLGFVLAWGSSFLAAAVYAPQFERDLARWAASRDRCPADAIELSAGS